MSRRHPPANKTWGKLGGIIPVLDYAFGGDEDAKFYYDQEYGRSKQESGWAEKGLLFALLYVSITRDINNKQYRSDVLRWIKNRATWGIFSFNYICSTFGIDSNAARKAILERVERKGYGKTVRYRKNGNRVLLRPGSRTRQVPHVSGVSVAAVGNRT